MTETVAVQQQLEAVPSPLGQGFQGRSSATSVRLLQSAGGSNPQSPVAQPQAANPSANPLNTNRVDNRGSLMLESRDATQQNAVIHRSYIKK